MNRSICLLLVCQLPALPAGAQTAPVSITFSTSSTWQTGYSADVTVTNNSPAVISGWTIAFGLPMAFSLTMLTWGGVEYPAASLGAINGARCATRRTPHSAPVSMRTA